MSVPSPTVDMPAAVRGENPLWMDRIVWTLTLLYIPAIIFSIALAQVVAGGLFLLWLGGALLFGRRLFRHTALDYPYLAVIAARLIAIPLSVDPGASVRALYVEMPFYLLFFLFTATMDLSREDALAGVMKVMIASAVVAAAVGMGKYVLGLEPRASSTTAGYYTLGIYLMATLPAALFLRNERSVFPTPVLWAAASVIIMLGIVFTFNRIHWLGMLLCVIVVGLLQERRLLLLFGVGAIVLAAAVPSVTERLAQSLSFTSHSSGRDVLWRGAAMLYDERPLFGFGLRTFDQIFPLRDELADKGIGSWHNDYLQMYMEAGLVGLAALAWFAAAVLIRGVRYLGPTLRARREGPIIAGIALSLMLFVILGGVFDTLGGLLFRLQLALFALAVTRGSPRMPEAAIRH